MEMCSKVFSESEPQKKAIGAAIFQSRYQTFQIFLHARHREMNMKLELHSSNAKSLGLVYFIGNFHDFLNNISVRNLGCNF